MSSSAGRPGKVVTPGRWAEKKGTAERLGRGLEEAASCGSWHRRWVSDKGRRAHAGSSSFGLSLGPEERGIERLTTKGIICFPTLLAVSHRITECSGLEGTSVGHPVQPPAQAGSPTAGCTGPCPGSWLTLEN